MSKATDALKVALKELDGAEPGSPEQTARAAVRQALEALEAAK